MGDSEKVKRRGVHPHTFLLSDDHFKRIGQSARKVGISNNAVVRAALDQYFSATEDASELQQLRQEVHAMRDFHAQTVELMTKQMAHLLGLSAGVWSTALRGSPPNALLYEQGQAWLDSYGLQGLANPFQPRRDEDREADELVKGNNS